ncbi:D-alanyl-D-alanine carboxypeptidase/D-alanyl-D-alanine-endopeptidase [Haladaptatus sp. T7]|uniref:D-alanyl-D-alanine carboxypeptidase/D-alanyl-D-alanine endopeptidase n=1 Tax=Haladaptatus sp. T7 TaxID=2029368 RepID=UPI0021A259D9|nr:D-alanyl-D-alanine carboxypeptidase/D-alanyl-D-alanine-endopeptidase [Haladaptatus sp. T7]GKZ12481.1 D-alanyl-D-alanine carboxypeptidase DacC [Haladaptatus sp. T7]
MGDKIWQLDRRTMLGATGTVGANAMFGDTALANRTGVDDETGESGCSAVGRLLESASEKFPGGIVSVYAKEAGADGDVLASHQADTVVKPASNTKLLTTALAFEHMGPDERFETSVVGDGSITGNQLHGDLVLRGTGDVLSTADLERLAEQVAENGVRTVHGDLVADITAFDTSGYGPVFSVRGPGYPEGWTWEDPQYSYGAPSSTLALHWNKVSLTAKRTENGIDLAVEPDSEFVTVESHLSTAPEGANGYFYTYLDRVNGTIYAIGELPPGYEETELAPVMRPDEHATAVFRDRLADAGVSVKGDVVLQTEPTEREAAFETSIESEPLRETTGPMLLYSNNVDADQLALMTARRALDDGSFDAWTELTGAYFESLGSPATVFRDGSGLSQFNLVSAADMVSLLEWIRKKPWSETLIGSLPTPGEGTLAYRLRDVDVPVHAKTGTVRGTRALSGVIERPTDPDVLFSILMSNVTVGLGDARNYQDDLVRALIDA